MATDTLPSLLYVHDALTGDPVPVTGDYAIDPADGQRKWLQTVTAPELATVVNSLATMVQQLTNGIATRDNTPLETALDDSGETLTLAATDGVQPILLGGNGVVKIQLQFFSADPTDQATYAHFSFNKKPFAMRLYHGGGSPDLFTADSVDVRIVGAGSGVICYQTWGTV